MPEVQDLTDYMSGIYYPANVPVSDSNTYRDRIAELAVALRSAQIQVRQRDEVNTRQSERITRLETERTTLVRAMDEFRDQVRDVAIEAHHAGHWCKSGMNDKLRELGLDPYNETFTGSVSLTVDVTVHGADSESEAQEMVENAITVRGDNSVAIDGWNADSIDVEPEDS